MGVPTLSVRPMTVRLVISCSAGFAVGYTESAVLDGELIGPRWW